MITVDVGRLAKGLEDAIIKQLPFITARALQSLAKVGAENQQRVTNEAIDRPNPFTAKNSIYFKPVDRRGPFETTIGYKSKQASYLAPILGGERRQKPFEKRIDGQVKFVVPGDELAGKGIDGIKLDRYGNITESDLLKILGEASSETNTFGTAKRFFRGVPKGNQGFGDGVYARVDNNNRIVPVLLFVTAAQYEKRVTFDDTAKLIAKQWPVEFQKALDYALANPR